MLNELKYREKIGEPIRIGLIGAGAMGLGIVLQICNTPGMELQFVADLDQNAAKKAQAIYGKPIALFTNADHALDDHRIELDVLVEASNSVVDAARYCMKAIRRRAHVVLMNAEVDLILGETLQQEARQYNVVVTSDGGDQHGVLARMIDEIEMWGFKITQAGNIKGFLNRYATAESMREIAKQMNLSLTQCIAYTDGTKLAIEMALIANGANLLPFVPGMQGPKASDVRESLNLFDFDAYGDQGCVDYLLGAQPGGGVYVIGRCDDVFQFQYMKYYKVINKFPYYLFYRPYHLCHLETPRAIALAAMWNKAVLTPRYGRLTDVYSYAKQPLLANTEIIRGIGGDQVYGLIHDAKSADHAKQLPIGLLEIEHGEEKPRLKRALAIDEPITFADVDLPDNQIIKLYREQQLLKKPESEVA